MSKVFFARELSKVEVLLLTVWRYFSEQQAPDQYPEQIWQFYDSVTVAWPGRRVRFFFIILRIYGIKRAPVDNPPGSNEIRTQVDTPGRVLERQLTLGFFGGICGGLTR